VGKKENFKIKTHKRVLENQRKLKGMIDLKRTPRASPLRVVSTVDEDLKVKR
jgi:hypothetical protein